MSGGIGSLGRMTVIAVVVYVTADLELVLKRQDGSCERQCVVCLDSEDHLQVVSVAA